MGVCSLSVSLGDEAEVPSLAEITFEFPFRIPPYSALIIRAVSVLEGIALVGNPQFAIVDEAYPYISKRLLTDDSPRLREALRYMVYGKSQTFDVDRVIDLLQALERTPTIPTDRRLPAACHPAQISAADHPFPCCRPSRSSSPFATPATALHTR